MSDDYPHDTEAIEIQTNIDVHASPCENADNIIGALRDTLGQEALREADAGDTHAAYTSALATELDARVTQPRRDPGDTDLRHLVEGEPYVAEADDLIRQLLTLLMKTAPKVDGVLRENLLAIGVELNHRIDGGETQSHGSSEA